MSRKTVFKVSGYFVAGILVLAFTAAVVVYGVSSYKLNRKYSVHAREVAIPNTATAIERGRHLATTRGCMDCHGSDLSGHQVINDPMVGKLHGSNLTRGVGGLPADFSDSDFVRAIRHGVARDGRPLVLMPSAEFTMLTDEDVGTLIAYLKSVPNVDRPRGPVSPGPVLRLLMVLDKFKLAATEIDHSATHVASITPAISVEYGKYLAFGCVGCHGPNLSGGRIPGGPPDWPSAANLTPHGTARIAQWNETQFVEAIRTRRRPDGTVIDPVMPNAFAQMTDVELKALWAYISTLPPVATGMR
jgi:mono/diheme cytochrome c family protein